MSSFVVKLENKANARPYVQGANAKKTMHAFFFFADCYHEVWRCRLTG